MSEDRDAAERLARSEDLQGDIPASPGVLDNRTRPERPNQSPSATSPSWNTYWQARTESSLAAMASISITAARSPAKTGLALSPGGFWYDPDMGRANGERDVCDLTDALETSEPDSPATAGVSRTPTLTDRRPGRWMATP